VSAIGSDTAYDGPCEDGRINCSNSMVGGSFLWARSEAGKPRPQPTGRPLQELCAQRHERAFCVSSSGRLRDYWSAFSVLEFNNETEEADFGLFA
jgi:hypothetical protein